jgi:phosphoglycerol transferase MdoB-like AlkP superfamily enzyme
MLFLVIFILIKPLFLLCNWNTSTDAGFVSCLLAIRHGFSMDMSVAGYCTIIPALLMLVSIFFDGKIIIRILRIYCFLVALLTALIFIPDLILYPYWGFRIDATVFNYLDHPIEVAASVSWWVVVAAFASVILWVILQYFVCNKFIINKIENLQKLIDKKHKLICASCLTVLIAVLVLVSRGGITVSTMNVGRVYFSDKMYLNHAAINPVFNMLSSISHLQEKFSEKYRFMPDNEANRLFNQLEISSAQSDSIPDVLATTRPNIVFILLESCGAAVVEALGGVNGVMPNLEKLAEEGLFFRNMFANSFRTDRGLAAILAGYPAQPDMSIIKFPAKSQHLHSIPAVLTQNGYHSSYFYGGDVDFANVKSFLISQKVTDIVCDADFPVKDLLNKWGAPDHIAFPRLLDSIESENKEPFLKIFLTLSSHEPFDVPYKKFSDPYLNSVAYTDSCLGRFVDELKQTSAWENTLLVLLPDHAMLYPNTIPYNSPERHKIYMIWAGGALKTHGIVDKICMQTDIAATLLSQMEIDSSAFRFSRDILNSGFTDFAFYAFSEGFGVVNRDGNAVYDCRSGRMISSSGSGSDSLILLGKAYLQKLFDDIDGL